MWLNCVEGKMVSVHSLIGQVSGKFKE